MCAIDSEDQRKLLGLEKRWIMNGQGGKMWRESEKDVVRFRAPQRYVVISINGSVMWAEEKTLWLCLSELYV